MALIDALQSGLAVEHQAVYGYGLVAAQLRKAERKRALDALEAHQLRRDEIAELITGLRAEPTPAAPAYVPSTPVVDETSARALAAGLEDASAGAAWDIVTAAPASSRSRLLGVAWLADAADRGRFWQLLQGSTPPALPGQPSASQPSTSGTSPSSVSTTPSGSTS